MISLGCAFYGDEEPNEHIAHNKMKRKIIKTTLGDLISSAFSAGKDKQAVAALVAKAKTPDGRRIRVV